MAKWLDKFLNQVQGLHVPPCIAIAPIPNVSGAVDDLARIPHQEGEPPMRVDAVPVFNFDTESFRCLSELTKEIDTHFEEIGHVIQENRLQVLPLGDIFIGENTNVASVQFPIIKKDIKEISKLVH